jgi:hypothetical protein
MACGLSASKNAIKKSRTLIMLGQNINEWLSLDF